MKTVELLKMHAHDKIIHKRYGECVIKEIMFSFEDFFGVVIRPQTTKGLAILAIDSCTDIPDFLEDSVRQLQAVV